MTSPRHHVIKAGTPPDREQEAEVLAALPEVEGDLRAVFLKAVEGAEVDATALIRSDDEEGVRAAIAFGVERGAKVAADALPDIVRERLKPNAISAELESWIKKHTGALVTAVNKESRNAIKATIARATREGVSMRDVRRELKSFVGLHRIGANALLNYRAQLAAEDRDPEQVRRMVAKYGNQLLNWRADNIARTEAMAAVSAGRQRGWERAAKDGLIDRNRTKRKWITSRDERTCRVCAPMDGQEVGLEEPFTTGTGENAMTPPVHPSCRCTVALTFAPLGARATVVDTTATGTAEPEVVVPGTVIAPPPVVDSPVAGGRTEEGDAAVLAASVDSVMRELAEARSRGVIGWGRRLEEWEKEDPELVLVLNKYIGSTVYVKRVRAVATGDQEGATKEELLGAELLPKLARAPARPEDAVTMFRGMNLPSPAIAGLQAGAQFDLGPVASFATTRQRIGEDAPYSEAEDIAVDFAKHGEGDVRGVPTVFVVPGDGVLRGTYVAPVANGRTYDENEFLTGGVVEVVSTEWKKGTNRDYLYVHVRQIGEVK